MGSSKTNALHPNQVAIRTYPGEGKGPALPLLGKFAATLLRGGKEITETMYVVKGRGNTALLSRQAEERMGLVEYHLDMTSRTPLPLKEENGQATADLVEEYRPRDVFSGLGKLRGVKEKLQANPDAQGAVQKQRRISMPLKYKFD